MENVDEYRWRFHQLHLHWRLSKNSETIMQSDCDKLLTEVMMDEAFGYLQGKIISDFEIDDVGRYVLKFNDGSVIDVEPTPNNENDLDLSGDWMIANNNWLLSYETDKHLDLVVDA